MEKINIKENLHWIIPSIITASGFVISTFLVGLLFLLISFIYIIYHFFGNKIVDFYNNNLKEKINKTGRIKFILIILLLLILIFAGLFFYFYNSTPKIFELTKGFNLKFEDKFEGGNFSNDENFQWIIPDNEFVNGNNNSKTLKTSSLKERGYPFYQNLKKLTGDRILLAKFYVPEASRVGIQLVNTENFESNYILEDNFQECRIQTYEGKLNGTNYSRGFGDLVYRKDGPFQKENITEGVYYLLTKISGNKISCYFQKEGDNNYTEITVDKNLEFENLGGPVLTRFIDNKANYPEILDFKIYTK